MEISGISLGTTSRSRLRARAFLRHNKYKVVLRVVSDIEPDTEKSLRISFIPIAKKLKLSYELTRIQTVLVVI